MASPKDVVSGLTGGGDFNADNLDPPKGQVQILQRAVVIDTIDNFSLRSKEQLDVIREGMTESMIEVLSEAPRNSLIVKISTGGEARSSDVQKNLKVLYPLFSSHLALPCKPGEQVWAIYETDSVSGIGYWISRVTSPVHAEDLNYSHHDRRNDPISKEETEGVAGPEGKPIISKNPGFPNGPVWAISHADSYTLKEALGYEKLLELTPEINDFVFEPVPRLTKRPGDLVIQGSNNACIILGTDRGWTDDSSPEPDSSNAHMSDPLEPGKGAIDIVVGRGRINVSLEDLAGTEQIESAWPETPEGEKLLAGPGQTPERTEPQITMNSRMYFETDKNLSEITDGVSNGLPTRQSEGEEYTEVTNAAEGDPDFVNDASRLYLTMKSNPDQDFTITSLNVPSLMDGALEASTDRAAAVLKSDEVRIIARKIGDKSPTIGSQPSGKNKAEPYNGSIRLIKEGESSDDAAAIYMLPDGSVQISGSKIFIGKSKDDDGVGGGPGPGNSQPYVKYQDLEDLWNDLMQALEDYCMKVATHTTPGFGFPSPQLLDACTGLMSSLIELRPKIANVKSERIFGE